MLGAISYITCPGEGVWVVPRATWHGTQPERLVCAAVQTERFRSDHCAYLVDSGLRIRTCLKPIAIVLLILWALGLVSSYSMGGLIHILLVVAIVMILVRVIQGRRI